MKKQISDAAWDLIEMCSYADDGIMPVSGGVLDQTPAFLRAYRMVQNERARVELEILKRK